MDASHDATLSHLNQAGHAYDASVLRELIAWIEESKVKQIDAVTEDIIVRIRAECKLRQTLLDERQSQTSLSSMGQSPVAKSISRRRGSLSANSESFQGKNWLKKEQALVEDHFGRRASLQDSAHDEVRASSCRLSRGVLSDSMIKQAIEDSKDSFFKEGSVMKTLLDSTTEIVWISDRHREFSVLVRSCAIVLKEMILTALCFCISRRRDLLHLRRQRDLDGLCRLQRSREKPIESVFESGHVNFSKPNCPRRL